MEKITVVDPTGAGDTLTWILLGGLALGCSIEKAAHGAARLAEAIASQSGARLPTIAARVPE